MVFFKKALLFIYQLIGTGQVQPSSVWFSLSAEMEKVIKIAEIDFWPKKISTKKWPENDPK